MSNHNIQAIYRSLFIEIKKEKKYNNLSLANLCDISEQYISDFLRDNRELNFSAIQSVLIFFQIKFDCSEETYLQAQKDFFKLLDFFYSKNDQFEEKIKEYKNNVYHYSLGYYYYHFTLILEILFVSKKYDLLEFEFKTLLLSHNYFDDIEKQIIKFLYIASLYKADNENLKKFDFAFTSSYFHGNVMTRQQNGLEGYICDFESLIAFQNGYFNEALSKNKRALDCFVKGGYVLQIVDSKMCEGNFYLMKGSYKEAIESYQSIIFMCEQLHYRERDIVKCKINISFAYLLQDQYQNCITELTSLKEKEDAFPNIYFNLFFAYYLLDKMNLAKQTYKKIQILQSNKSQKKFITSIGKLLSNISSEELIAMYESLIKSGIQFDDKILIIKAIIKYMKNINDWKNCVYFQQELLNCFK